jgi:hypothetical protein
VYVPPGQVHEPGDSPAQVDIPGDYILDGSLRIEIGGTVPGLEYDQLLVEGTAVLNGTVEIVLINGFVPADGDIFDIIIAQSFEFGEDFAIAFSELPDGFHFIYGLFDLGDGRSAFRLVAAATAVEPRAVAVFAVMTVLLTLRRKRRRAATS